MNLLPKRYLMVVSILIVVLSGCARKESSQDLKEQTAQATAEMKQNAKAVASGIREGWNRDKSVNLNSASKDQLVALPGISSAEADHIIEARPFKTTDELVSRRIVSKAEYDKIADRVTAN
jgi:DNA uptake protein ComE-like DNA-binding protein